MSSAAKIPIRSTRVPPATRLVALPGPFTLRRGGVLAQAQIGYESWGTLSPARDNVVLLFTGLSPSAHAASHPQDPTPGWWEYMIGPGRPLDTRRYHILCVNSLGSCFGSTGPASTDPASGEPYRLNFPALCVEDIATAARTALHALGIWHVHTVVGASLGGESALAYAVLFPEEVENLILISSAAHATPYAIALRSLQREIVRADPQWRGGFYPEDGGPRTGLYLARKLGLISYRSLAEWQERFGRQRVPGAEEPRADFGIEFQIEAYLDANARKFADSFDANCYLYLSRAMDWFDIAEHGGGSLETALARVRARRALVVGVETDTLFPLWQQRELAEGLRAAGCTVSFAALPSIQGHDAFLVDKERFAPLIAAFLAAR